MKNMLQSYSDIELDTEVLTASNHRLIQMLLNKCVQHVDQCKSAILAQDTLRKAQSISKALDIIEYLRVCLNHQDARAKNLSGLLDSLYAYLQRQMAQANQTNDLQSLDLANKILMDIKSGWDGIENSK